MVPGRDHVFAFDIAQEHQILACNFAHLVDGPRPSNSLSDQIFEHAQRQQVVTTLPGRLQGMLELIFWLLLQLVVLIWHSW